MNDPNGLVWYAGEYHLFYQYHPHSAIWGPMHWGHAISTDLIHWEHLPIALYPDKHGMIFSGSAVVDWNNTSGFGREAMVAIFTYHNDHQESQSLAYSTDRGRTWIKYPGNPVIPTPADQRDFRDPKVFWYIDHWCMVLAAGNTILFYASTDLKAWTQTGSFGHGHGATGGVWETPDLFQLPVNGGPETRWMLTIGVGNGGPAGGSGTQYFIGHFDGRNFISENPPETILWMDHGADFYAAQSWNDEPQQRRIMLAWMSNWQYAISAPTETWRGSLSLPREITLTRTRQGIRLVQRPIQALENLRERHHHIRSQVVHPGENPLAEMGGDCLEIDAEITLNPSVTRCGFCVRVGADEAATIACDGLGQTINVDRSRSGQVDFKDGFAAVHSAPRIGAPDILKLHILIDRFSIEVFADDGQIVMTESIFPSPESLRVAMFAEGGPVELTRLDIYDLARRP